MRVNKYIASSINISRRKADEYIKKGLVSVNGKVVKDFVDIKDNDVVMVKREVVVPVNKKYYFAFYKPPYVLSATKDLSDKKVVCDFFQDIDTKLICIGRLDYVSEGLLLVTNDGDFANMVMHPKYKLVKTYLVKTKHKLTKEFIEELSKGAKLEDGFFKPLKVSQTENSFWILIKMDSGRNRIIRRFFKHFDIPIIKLKRIAIENIKLGALKEGEYRILSKEEIDKIKKRQTFAKY